MADYAFAFDPDLYQEGVAVAVGVNGKNPETISAGLTLRPQLVTCSAEERDVSGQTGSDQGRDIIGNEPLEDGSSRRTIVQCVNRGTLTQAKAEHDMQRMGLVLDTLKIRSPITLTGLSMGGPITAAFTVQHPERVSRNVFIDPSGVHKLSLGGLSVGLVPGVGELVLGLFGSERLVKNIASDFFDPALVEHFQARYRPQMRFAGFKRSILSTLRSGMLGDFSDVYQSLSRLQKPTLIFWGREDTTVPFPHSADLARILPLAELRVIEGCGHIPHYEKPEQFNPALLSFLQRGA